ncbi:chromate transporter [Paraglaciecola aquimarina]|uniref:chromate transporter n=1 Tax=Paraglaciecola aquimarina TaxID=1235557 RepID=UPI003D17D792
MNESPAGWLGGLVCLLAIFIPSFLLVFGALPFWEHLRQSAQTQSALAGVNAAVVGLLLAALYQPVWTSAIHAPAGFWPCFTGICCAYVLEVTSMACSSRKWDRWVAVNHDTLK